jgi:hypothetical protein
MNQILTRDQALHPVTEVRKRNRKIQTLLAAVACALVAAVIVLAAPEIGLVAAATGSLVAGGSSAVLTIVARHMQT